MSDPEIIPPGSERRPLDGGAAGNTAFWIYILYLASLVFGITALIGLVLAYVNSDGAPGWLESHYRFQIRTFWIGLLYVAATLAAMFVFIGWLFVPLFYLWLILRCAKGLRAVSRGEPHPDPASWLFG